METKFKIYTQKTITNQDGTTQNILNQVGSATREELVKACNNAINQLIRAQEIVTIAAQKVEAVDAAILAEQTDIIITLPERVETVQAPTLDQRISDVEQVTEEIITNLNDKGIV